MQCNPDSVDETLPMRVPEILDDHEHAIHSQFIHMISLQKTIRRMVDVSSKLKAMPSWRNDPQFLKSAPALDNWLMKLPHYLQIQLSTDLNDRPPVVDSHFAGNLQVYYYLARMMLHRPALAYGKTFAQGGEWRHHMSECTSAAKAICRLEEVIFEQYGMLGFQCMSRGVNFSIYSLLSGAMIHLVRQTVLQTQILTRLTSPDRRYLSRPRIQRRRKGVLHAHYASAGKLHRQLCISGSKRPD